MAALLARFASFPSAKAAATAVAPEPDTAAAPPQPTATPPPGKEPADADREEPRATSPITVPAPHPNGGSRVADADAELNALVEAPFECLLGFLQCQLRMEAIRCLGVKEDLVALADPTARRIWVEYARWQRRYRDNYEKWVPYHTVLGVHELFAVREIRYAKGLTDRQRFLALFAFRAHCKRDLFTKAQLPYLRAPGFWKNPAAALAEGGPIETAMLEYRKKNPKVALQTNAFRAIPVRLCEDNEVNLVRNIIMRTRSLLTLGEAVWPWINKTGLTAEQMFEAILAEVRKVRGLGDTWAKMLTVAIDICYPDLGLLDAQCEVGIGALKGLQVLLSRVQFSDIKAALQEAQGMLNASKSPEAGHFWTMLHKVEEMGKACYSDCPLVIRQLSTQPRCMTASTLQVQLCEWRQFCEHLERIVCPGDAGELDTPPKAANPALGQKAEEQRQEPDKQKAAKGEEQRQEPDRQKAVKVEEQRQEPERQKAVKVEEQRQEPERQKAANQGLGQKVEEQRQEPDRQKATNQGLGQKAEEQRQELDKQKAPAAPAASGPSGPPLPVEPAPPAQNLNQQKEPESQALVKAKNNPAVRASVARMAMSVKQKSKEEELMSEVDQERAQHWELAQQHEDLKRELDTYKSNLASVRAQAKVVTDHLQQGEEKLRAAREELELLQSRLGPEAAPAKLGRQSVTQPVRKGQKRQATNALDQQLRPRPIDDDSDGNDEDEEGRKKPKLQDATGEPEYDTLKVENASLRAQVTSLTLQQHELQKLLQRFEA